MHQRMWEFRNALKNVGKFPSAPRNVGIANASKNVGISKCTKEFGKIRHSTLKKTSNKFSRSRRPCLQVQLHRAFFLFSHEAIPLDAWQSLPDTTDESVPHHPTSAPVVLSLAPTLQRERERDREIEKLSAPLHFVFFSLSSSFAAGIQMRSIA